MERPENVDFVLKDIRSNILDWYVEYLEDRIDKAIGLIYDYQMNDEDNVNYKELLYVLKGEE